MRNGIKRFLLTCFIAGFAFYGLSASASAKGIEPSVTSHYWGKIHGVWFQGPVAAVKIHSDQLFDLSVLDRFVGLNVAPRGNEWVYTYRSHQLDLQAGRSAALLDGRVTLLTHPPIAKEGYLLVPARQVLRLLGVPFEEDHGFVNLISTTDKWKKMLMSGVTENGRAILGFIGFLDSRRMVLATKPSIYDHNSGLSILYEGYWKSSDQFVLTKLRPLTDTSVDVYMETLPNGQVQQNLFLDQRPEFLIVETCSCAGRYNYATMFTVTEMGFTSIWHSQYSYDRIERSGKGWELVSYRKEKIPERASGVLPYWEIRESWTGSQFSIVKEIYHAPTK